MFSLDYWNYKNIGKWLIALVAIILCIKGFNLVRRWALLTPSTTSTHQITAGGENRIYLGSYVSVSRRPLSGREKHRKYATYCIDFTTSEPLEICIVPGIQGARLIDRAKQDKIAKDFASGKTPEVLAGHGSGASGRIYITDVLHEGNLASYTALVKSAKDCEVTIKAYHWRQ